MIKLYELAGQNPNLRFSPYCWRVRMALAHKGEEATLVPWRFSEKARLPGAPGNQKVPVLVDGNRVVADSTNIAFHLEERYGNGPSLFGGPGGEAHVRFVLAWADTVLIPAMAPIVVPAVLPQLHPNDRAYFQTTREARLGSFKDLVAEAEKHLAAFRRTLLPLRKTLEAQHFLGGDEPSYADYGVFGCFQWARCVASPALLEEGDTLLSWVDEMLDLFDGLARRATVAAQA